MSAAELNQYVSVWSEAVDDFVSLLSDLTEAQWAAATDLPGWSVHDVAAHIAHLEHLLAGGSHDDIDVGAPAHVVSAMGTFTEQGVVARKNRTAADLIAEIEAAAQARRAEFAAHPPSDPDAAAPGLFGAIGWNTRTLLRNRPLDVWLHEQDIRRALDLPGNLDAAAAAHTVNYLAANLGYVLAKRLKAPAGTSATLHVSGVGTWSAEVDAEGRGHSIEAPAHPTATVTVDIADFEALAGGRRPAVRPEVLGDLELGARILDGFHGLTP